MEKKIAIIALAAGICLGGITAVLVYAAGALVPLAVMAGVGIIPGGITATITILNQWDGHGKRGSSR